MIQHFEADIRCSSADGSGKKSQNEQQSCWFENFDDQKQDERLRAKVVSFARRESDNCKSLLGSGKVSVKGKQSEGQVFVREPRGFFKLPTRFKAPSSCSIRAPESIIDNRKLEDEEKGQVLGDGNAQVECENDVDGGYAWIILVVMFVINASTFGSARAYGQIFEKLARQEELGRAQAALPFTIMGAIENMGGPLTGCLLSWTRSWRPVMFLGSTLVVLSHLLAAFCHSQLSQILAMGLMCGLGLSFVTICSFQINNAYFVRYRSGAFGLCLTGAAVGTLYISPLCKYVLTNHSTSKCYLMLALVLAPNVPLSLLLKPKGEQLPPTGKGKCATICDRLDRMRPTGEPDGLWTNITSVLKNPIFHLIWPTQLLFCWLNFVMGMIILDFGEDRGLDGGSVEQLIPIWACGQLFGRVILGSLVDTRIISYKLFTVICLASISFSTWALNNIRDEDYEDKLLPILVFALSAFISNLYILFNGLIVNYMEKPLTALSLGISSFTGSFFLLPRAKVIGYYRDSTGNYDAMLAMFTYVSLAAALVWLTIPGACSKIRSLLKL